MKKICFVTSTRADYGLIRPLIIELKKYSDVELNLIVTGTHLLPEFGNSLNEIKTDNLLPVEEISIFKGTSKNQILDTMSNAIKKTGKFLNSLKPDLVVLLGDRYEIFAVASSCVVLNIPVAHLYGGEVTRGAIDDIFRHSITKMSNIHFTSCEEYKKRVIQLGENPDTVFNYGAIGLENIKNIKLLTKKEINQKFSIDVEDTMLTTFHPVTTETDAQLNQFKNLLDAIVEQKYFTLFTMPNADTNSKQLEVLLKKYIKKYPEKIKLIENLGTQNYLSIMKYAKCVLGNSSSGIYEAPSFKTPTINIGSRQNGRLQAKSIINCAPQKNEILKTIQKLDDKNFNEILKTTKNLFEQKNTSKNIAKKIVEFLDKPKSAKVFYDL